MKINNEGQLSLIVRDVLRSANIGFLNLEGANVGPSGIPDLFVAGGRIKHALGQGYFLELKVVKSEDCKIPWRKNQLFEARALLKEGIPYFLLVHSKATSLSYLIRINYSSAKFVLKDAKLSKIISISPSCEEIKCSRTDYVRTFVGDPLS